MAPMPPYGTTTEGTQPIGMLTSELLPRNWNVWVLSLPRSMNSLMPPLLGPALIHCDESWIDDPRLAAHSASPLAPPAAALGMLNLSRVPIFNAEFWLNVEKNAPISAPVMAPLMAPMRTCFQKPSAVPLPPANPIAAPVPAPVKTPWIAPTAAPPSS